MQTAQQLDALRQLVDIVNEAVEEAGPDGVPRSVAYLTLARAVPAFTLDAYLVLERRLVLSGVTVLAGDRLVAARYLD
jgi:hypothetical protein